MGMVIDLGTLDFTVLGIFTIVVIFPIYLLIHIDDIPCEIPRNMETIQSKAYHAKVQQWANAVILNMQIHKERRINSVGLHPALGGRFDRHMGRLIDA